jgi:hypothetical protein
LNRHGTNDCKWQVNDLHYYKTYTVEDSQDLSNSIFLLVPLNAANRNNGIFRLILVGGTPENIQIPTADIFPSLPNSLQATIINIPCDTSRIIFPENSTACNWMDAVEMIRNVNSHT